MAFTSKPTFIPEWASTDVYNAETETYNVVAPDDAKKELGWDAYEKPPRNYMNWLQRGNYQWIEYFEQFFSDSHELLVDVIEPNGASGVTIDGVNIKNGEFIGNQVMAGELTLRGSGTSSRLRIQTAGSGTGSDDGLKIVLIDASHGSIVLAESLPLLLLTNNTERLRLAASTPQITVANNARDLVNSSGYVVADKQRETGAASGVLNTKIIEIGDWNMDSTGYVEVAHGLTFSKIRKVSALIRNDVDNFRAHLEGKVAYTEGAVTDCFDGGSIGLYSTNVLLCRIASGHFDSTSYDLTSATNSGVVYNRGWITIEYVD